MYVLLSTAYFPPIEWVAQAVQSSGIVLEANEHFQKQSYRSRMHIAGPNGMQRLSVPVERKSKDIKSIRISYNENWSKDHLKAIESAYANAPYFEVLFPDVKALLQERFETLWELNSASIALFSQWLEIELVKDETFEYVAITGNKDLRDIHPKTQSNMNFPSYGQVFQHKIGFQNNLSALDLFFNLGRSSWDYLNALK
ncbi:WbqC family protein [Schleiferiaceae bacterium]|nr:WbqC family protein [Schleiferiaceae bacterium]MDC3217400.1 WbqC family protein [Schleiferiaceae bacterium]